MKRAPGETGEAGEHLVLAELYRRGVLGSQAARGARGIDLLTSTGRTLQVKTRRGTGRWVLGQVGHRPSADIVVLVSVGEHHLDDQFFLVPATVLYDWAEDRHRTYWASRHNALSGERALVQLKEGGPIIAGFQPVKEFLKPFEDNWGLVSNRS